MDQDSLIRAGPGQEGRRVSAQAFWNRHHTAAGRRDGRSRRGGRSVQNVCEVVRRNASERQRSRECRSAGQQAPGAAACRRVRRTETRRAVCTGGFLAHEFVLTKCFDRRPVFIRRARYGYGQEFVLFAYQDNETFSRIGHCHAGAKTAKESAVPKSGNPDGATPEPKVFAIKFCDIAQRSVGAAAHADEITVVQFGNNRCARWDQSLRHAADVGRRQQKHRNEGQRDGNDAKENDKPRLERTGVALSAKGHRADVWGVGALTQDRTGARASSPAAACDV